MTFTILACAALWFFAARAICRSMPPNDAERERRLERRRFDRTVEQMKNDVRVRGR